LKLVITLKTAIMFHKHLHEEVHKAQQLQRAK